MKFQFTWLVCTSKGIVVRRAGDGDSSTAVRLDDLVGREVVRAGGDAAKRHKNKLNLNLIKIFKTRMANKDKKPLKGLKS